MPHFASQRPDEFGWRLGRAATIVPFTYDGHPFPSGVAAGTERIWTTALDRLCAQPGFTLPPSRGLDAGMWGFHDRRKAGGSGWSFHAYGLALDVAAPWNPYGSRRPAAHPHRLPTNTGELVRDLGLLWGAEFDDWMHLELHLSPEETAAVVAAHGAGNPRESRDGGFPLPDGWYFGPRSGPDRSVSNLVNERPAWVAALARVQVVLGVPADGRYGPVTAAAARAWQAAHGLQADGLIGARTWARMFA
jgi:peptidoglycan hydrolase-like protein with peptidoglycan-binding domain